MPPKPKFPGQAERTNFSLEQVKSLSSAIRTEVFWSFNEFEPHSAAEVAASIGKSAQTVHYHVNELVRAGLLIGVETRRKRARTETLYVHASRAFFSQSEGASAEYRSYTLKGFAAMARQMVRATTAVHKAIDEGDSSIRKFHAYRRATTRLSPERALELKKLISEFLRKAEEMENEEGLRVNLSVFMSPTPGETKKRIQELRSKRKPARKKRE